MDYGKEIEAFGKDMIDELILKITPDDAIEAINDLVHTAIDKDLTGKQKFEWVVGEALELLIDVWEFILPRLVQILYEIMMAKAIEYGK